MTGAPATTETVSKLVVTSGPKAGVEVDLGRFERHGRARMVGQRPEDRGHVLVGRLDPGAVERHAALAGPVGALNAAEQAVYDAIKPLYAQYRPKVIEALTKAGDDLAPALQELAAMALMKRSPKMTANCALAMVHSRGGIFHSFSDRFKMR